MVDVKKTVGVYKGFTIVVTVDTEYKTVYASATSLGGDHLSAIESGVFILYTDGRMEARVRRVINKLKRQIDELDSVKERNCEIIKRVSL